MRHAPCTVCGGDVTTPAYDVGTWRIVDCRACGHRYVDPRPDLAQLQAEIYDESYFANPAFRRTDHDGYHGYMDYLGDRPYIQARVGEVLARVAGHVAPPGRLLDVGCGLGFLVEVAEHAGWEAWGVELNPHAVAWAREHVSERIVHTPVHDLPFDDGSLDVVTLFDVIEHLPDPAHDLTEVSRVLRPGGLLVVVTPDAGSLMARILRSRWQEVRRVPEHLHFFDVPGLSRLLGGIGLAPLEWHTMGKITSLRSVLADLKFYAPRLFGTAQRGLDRLGLTDRIVDVDPRSKICLYARKQDAPGAALPTRVERRRPMFRMLPELDVTVDVRAR